MTRQLTAEQQEALKEYAKKNGRTWKSKLIFDWLESRTQGPLQEVRNQFGPTWLMSQEGTKAVR